MRIAFVGWSGDDGTGFGPPGLYPVNDQETMRGMIADGFNTIRIPVVRPSAYEKCHHRSDVL